MGTEEKINEIHVKVGELSADVKWLINSKSETRTLFMWSAGIGLPIILSLILTLSMFAATIVKRVDILTALHKSQVTMFELIDKDK